MTDVRDALLVARNSEGRLIRRPLSPHLQVYRPQISSVLSVLHRATGIALSVGTILLTWWLVAAASSDAAFAAVQWFASSVLGVILLLGWTACLWYHFLAGIRHLCWDAGFGFEIPTFHKTGWAVLIGTGVLTVLTWIVGVAVWL
jgi:succinate dehydrogenase / fumarate reductase cytochrome b subunit